MSATFCIDSKNALMAHTADLGENNDVTAEKSKEFERKHQQHQHPQQSEPFGNNTSLISVVCVS